MPQVDLIRIAAVLAAASLAGGCQRAESPASAPDTRSPSNASAPASSAGGGNAAMLRYLTEHGRDVEACFTGMPALETEAAGADLRAGGTAPAARVGRVVIAIDASGSMAARIGGEPKMAAAKRAASEFLASLPADVSVGLLAFGHRGSNRAADKPASCAATEAVYAVGPFNRPRVATALEGFDARGWTPLAAAIEQSGRMLGSAAEGAPQAVYVVSDGKDTCDGDPIAAARALHAGGTRAVVNVIGFDLAAADRAELEAVAKAGGGVFTEVEPAGTLDLSSELQRQNRNFSEQLRAGNANFGRQLGNDNRTFAAGLKLTNCVFTRGLQEGNGFASWAREQGLPEAEAAAGGEALNARQAALTARAEVIVAQAEQATNATNARLQSAQDAVDRKAAEVR